MPQKRWLRWLAGFVLSLLVLMAAAVFVLPRVIQSTGARIASEALGRAVTIGEVSVQPWRLALELKDLRIAGSRDQDPPLFEMAQAKVALSARTFWHFVPVIESVALSRPVLRLSRTAPGAYDVDDLIAKFSAKPAEPSSGPPPALALYNITLDQGQVLFDDQPMARKHELVHLNIGLPFLSTRDADVKVLVQPSVSGQLNGVEFGSQVEALPFSAERDATLRFKLGSLDLAPYIPYVPAGLPLRLAAGKVDADLTVRFQQPPKQAPKLDISGRVGLSEFDLQQPDSKPWLAWQKLSIGLQTVQPFQQKLAFGEVNWQGLRLNLARDVAGNLWLPTAAPAPAAPAAKVQDQQQAKAVPSAPAAPAWAISLAKFSLGDAQVNWRDASVPGKAALQAKALKLELGTVQWPLKALTPLSFDMQIQPEGAAAKPGGKKAESAVAAANLKGQGSLSPAEAKLDLQWDQLALQWFEPYWAAQLPMQLKAKAAGRLSLGVTQPLDADPLARLQVGVQDLLIEQLALGASKSPTAEPLLRLDSVKLDRLDMAYGAKTVQLGELSLDAPGLMLARAKNNDWNWQALLPQSESAKVVSKPVPRGRPVLKLGGEDDAGRVSVATSTAPAASTSKSATDWQVALRELKLNRGSVRLQDAAAPGGQANLSVQQLTLRLGQLAWPKASGSSPAQLSFKLAGEAVAKQAASRKGLRASAPDRPLSALSKAAANSPGSFSWQGNIALAPLAASGKLRAERLPLQLLSAYMDPSLDLNLQRVDLGWRGDFNVRQLPKDWQVNVNGDLLLADLSLQQGRKQAAMGLPGTDLLTWQAFHLDGVRFEMKPGSKPDLAVKELRLNDFYASVLINEKGRLNLSDIRAEQDAAPAKPASEAGIALVASPATSTAPAASAAPGSAAANAAPGANLPIQISLGQTTLSKGRVDFADRFIRPNYSAQLTELQGGLGAVRSGRAEMAPLQLRGRVAGTGLLAIDGALNPLGAPLMLDIKASATDIELAPMSPYAEKYAGYQIERGKLSTKVAYKIDPDGQLKASNQLILNQLTFGEAVNSPDATKLPVRLAVSLLKDSDGVIDVELPVSGSLNDPQFSVGGVIFKLIINMIGKALTSPFSLLAGAGGSEQSQIEFALGSAQPSNPATLEKIAKALADKPTLALTITGWADLALERSALQQAQLDAALLAQKRLELQRRQTAGADAQAAAELMLSEAERNRLLKVVYEATKLPNKPRNMLGFAKDISVAEMRSLMLASYTVNEETAHALSLARGVAVRDGLIAKGLPNQRIFVAAPKLHSAEAGDSGWKPLVELKLGGD
ncbi:DUF748 domain-containing protein [Roseateles sp. PN1]|uniref:DUF748 domain-containing protein n=1 Tax=Roseateles sp. PN1 TaxID=3137372 RepID=UPI003139A492